MRLDAPARRRLRIGLTPLIDVVFILLLFFMLTTRFAQQQAIPLRMSGTAEAGSQALPERVVLRLDANGTLGLADGTTLPLDRLAEHPAVASLRERSSPIVLQVADEAPLQALVSTIDRLEAAGLPDVSVRGLR